MVNSILVKVNYVSGKKAKIQKEQHKMLRGLAKEVGVNGMCKYKGAFYASFADPIRACLFRYKIGKRGYGAYFDFTGKGNFDD